MVYFKNMSDEEFQQFRLRSLNEYAESIHQNYGGTKEEALENATSQFNELLKDGLQTENQWIYHIVDDETENKVGIVWYAYRAEHQQVFLYEIWMDPKYRGNGHGTQAIQLLHQKAKELGANNVGLHVFGFNKGAIALYKRLGYEENSIVMQYQL